MAYKIIYLVALLPALSRAQSSIPDFTSAPGTVAAADQQGGGKTNDMKDTFSNAMKDAAKIIKLASEDGLSSVKDLKCVLQFPSTRCPKTQAGLMEFMGNNFSAMASGVWALITNKESRNSYLIPDSTGTGTTDSSLVPYAPSVAAYKSLCGQDAAKCGCEGEAATASPFCSPQAMAELLGSVDEIKNRLSNGQLPPEAAGVPMFIGSAEDALNDLKRSLAALTEVQAAAAREHATGRRDAEAENAKADLASLSAAANPSASRQANFRQDDRIPEHIIIENALELQAIPTGRSLPIFERATLRHTGFEGYRRLMMAKTEALRKKWTKEQELKAIQTRALASMEKPKPVGKLTRISTAIKAGRLLRESSKQAGHGLTP